MAQRKTFPLRLPPELYDALQRWADGELRSVNGQMEFLLREALQRAGRLPPAILDRGTDRGTESITAEAEEGTEQPTDPKTDSH